MSFNTFMVCFIIHLELMLTTRWPHDLPDDTPTGYGECGIAFPAKKMLTE